VTAKLRDSGETEDAAGALLPVRAEEVAEWDAHHDVVVVGLGAAGGAAAIESARAGCDTLVVERMTRGGGATALSTGITYFGGGTPIQRACGFEDTPEDMRAFVTLAAGEGADPERIRLYCEGSLEHFEWFRALGVEFNESFLDDKVTHPLTDQCLTYSGGEQAWPFSLQTPPRPRGHKPAREGEAGGYLMEAVLRGAEEAGVRVQGQCSAERLVLDSSGRVVGLIARSEGRELALAATRGVVLCSGGFIMNEAMLDKHAPALLDCNYKLGTPGDDGAGIRMGLGAGAAAINMHEGLLLNAYYPPSSHLKGILVDAGGQRFINEDSYLGRTSDAIVHRAAGRAFLIVDDTIRGRTQAFHKLVGVADDAAGLELELGLPGGSLVATLAEYNENAARGEDPQFHKAATYLQPLTPPLGALDCSTSNSIFGAFTLGGLSVQASGEVLRSNGRIVEGLFAAGRCTAGLCRQGKTYASGLSIGDASFFGRLAGRSAASSR
jgi:3-oxo-5alpha-steroid 4-dehydrogenase